MNYQTGFNPSEQQKAIMAFPSTQPGSCNVIARAGCGKTTTLVEVAKTLRGKVFMGAFNKAIAEELKVKIGNSFNVTAGTMHSLGFRLLRNLGPRYGSPNSFKVRQLVKPHFPINRGKGDPTLNICCDAISYAKQSGFGLKGIDFEDVQRWHELFDYYDLWEELPSHVRQSKVIAVCMDVYKASLDACIDPINPDIDFDDMLLAPMYHGKPAPLYDWFLMDEAQDTNEVRRRLATWVLRPGGRIIAVGDPAQAIYGFAGATNNAMDLIKAEMGSVEMPLSVTYRCPKAVVNLANTWVPDLTAHESAPEGSVKTVDHKELWQYRFNPATDVILCRNTRPLVGIAKRLRKSGILCMVEGVSGKALAALASKWGEDISIEEMEGYLYAWKELECKKWVEKANEEKAEAIAERVEMLMDIASELPDNAEVTSLLRLIENMFSDQDNNRTGVLKLCTIHRSKGREWNRVFLIGRNLYMPSKFAKQEWELQQEDNLAYVAVTRAKSELVEVITPRKKSSDSPDWWEL